VKELPVLLLLCAFMNSCQQLLSCLSHCCKRTV